MWCLSKCLVGTTPQETFLKCESETQWRLTFRDNIKWWYMMISEMRRGEMSQSLMIHISTFNSVEKVIITKAYGAWGGQVDTHSPAPFPSDFQPWGRISSRKLPLPDKFVCCVFVHVYHILHNQGSLTVLHGVRMAEWSKVTVASFYHLNVGGVSIARRSKSPVTSFVCDTKMTQQFRTSRRRNTCCLVYGFASSNSPRWQ